MVDCARCGRTLDATETKYSIGVRVITGQKVQIWCADCILKSPPQENSRP